jgi:hypothetical protein
LLLNRGDHFDVRSLPPEAQWAPAIGVEVGDADGDGHEDIFLSQNFFAVADNASRFDAGRGLWLMGDGTGNFRPLPASESGVWIYGEQRGAALGDYDGDGRFDLAVAQNGAAAKLFHGERATAGLRVRLNGPAGNLDGIGAVLRWGAGPARELHAGSGYWSQSTSVAILARPTPASPLTIRWPGGRVTTSDVPALSKEIAVSVDGKVEQLKPK